MKGIHKITILLLAILTLAACSRKKNTFLSRNYHAVTAEYNALYNGDNAFLAGQQQLEQTYRDNFWEILPVERFQQAEFGGKPGDTRDPNFEKAEEKAAKAIQRHSIYVDGQEYNPQIDEAYIMLGKARYFDQRFVPALDAFNFILNRYPLSNSINRAKIWKAKCNIRLRNEEIALEDLGELLEDVERGEVDIKDAELADVNAIMAEAYISEDTLEAALPHMKLATELVRNKELLGRYTYIKAQLYDRLEMPDSANMAYQEVIELNRKSPRIYMINAYIAQGQNFDYEAGDRTAFLELLRDLEEDRENRPYLDKIYYQIGEYYRNITVKDTAIMYYNKSIQSFKEDRILQATNYRTLAEMFFDDAEYKTAGKYYDSTLTFLEEKTRRWRRVKKKLDNLEDVIKYEDIAAKNDSILRIAAMSETQQKAFFKAYTDTLRAQARRDSIARIKAAEASIANNEFYKKSKKETEPGGAFYFYNSTTVSFGKQEFKRIWGDRNNEDYWRISEKTPKISADEIAAGVVPEETVSQSELMDPDYYLSKIPTDQKVIDSMTVDRNFAYYQLGLIYMEKFKENGLASDRLEKLLTYNPQERLVLPAKYNLYKIYERMEDASGANKYRDDILANYPDSRYAEILRNPNTALAADESSPEYKYKRLYEKFENYQYDEVIATAEQYILAYYGEPIVPKLELLKATALARRDGFEAYKKALNYVSLTYPTTDEGKQAQEIYSGILLGIATKNFGPGEESESWKVVYQFDSDQAEEAEALKTKLTEIINYYNYFKMSASVDYYDPNTLLVVMHGLKTRLGGTDLAQAFSENKKYKIRKPFFAISTPNYKIIQIHKNLDAYLNSASGVDENSNPQK